MPKLKFQSKPYHIDFLPEFSQLDVKQEPMFFSASSEFAWDNGGPYNPSFFILYEDTDTGSLAGKFYN